jgi:Zn-dependent protease
MPVNPHRFRGRHGEALVSAAGPAVNLLLALAVLAGVALWMRHTGFWDDQASPGVANTQRFLWYFGNTNVLLAIFNLIPLPPLDGSGILADFHRGYRDWIRRLAPGTALGLLIGLIVVLSYTPVGLWDVTRSISLGYVNAISGLGLHFK